jgi:hypothetical protein
LQAAHHGAKKSMITSRSPAPAMASTSCCTLPMWITLGGASFCHHLLVGSWKADTRMAAARSL